MNRSFTRCGQRLLLTSFVFLLAVVAGCRPAGPATGEVTGTVTHKGKPLPFGSIVFVGPDERSAAGTIKDGSYKIRNAPVGPVKIAVASHPRVPPALQKKLPGQPLPPLDGPDDPYLRIPPHYKDPEQSGLTCTIKEGQQTFDIPLK